MIRPLFCGMLSVSLVFSSVTPAVAEVNSSGSRPAQPSAQISDEKVLRAVQSAAENTTEGLVAFGEQMARRECAVQGLACIEKAAFESLKAAGWDKNNAEVCDRENTSCVPLIAFAQGGVRFVLAELLSYNGAAIAETADSFVSLVTQYGVQSEADRKAALAYFYALLEKAGEDCGSGFSVEYGSAAGRTDRRQAREQKAKRCANEMAGLHGMAMLSLDGAESRRAADAIGEFLEDKYNTDAAGVVMPSAAVALATLGTPRAWAVLEKFLLDESIPSLGGDMINISFETAAQNVLRAASNLRGGNSRYLNRINSGYQYLDQEESARQGHGNADWKSDGLQYPQGNLLEDLGRLVGQESAANENAARVARNIVRKANGYAKDGANAAGKIHYPVVLGVLDGWRMHGKKFVNEPDPALLALFYKGDWWDINEGTQRRVHYKAWQFAKLRGWTWQAPGKDEAKQERYIYNARLLNIGKGADVMLMPVLLMDLVVSLPAMARSLYGAVRMLQANRSLIGARIAAKARAVTGKATVKATPRAAPKASGVRTGVTTRTASPKGGVQPRGSGVSEAKAGPKPAAQPAPKKPVSPEAAAPAHSVSEPVSAVSKKQLDKKLLGSLDEKVQVARQTGSAYAERSLMPKAPKEAPKGLFEPRADGLVYMESHPTDPAKAVFYYADDMGKVVKAEEVPMSRYETLVKTMSSADRAVFGRSMDLYGEGIQAMRREREFTRLDALGKQIKDWRVKRTEISRTGKGTPPELEEIRRLDRQIAAAEREAGRTIRDMSSNGMGSENALKQIFQYAQESAPAQTVKPAGAVSAYAKRSLMPKAPKETPKGLFEPRADGLVYMEAHPSDPAKAVFYYADEAGNAVKAREVPMKRYETLVQGMSDADKAVLGRSSDLYGSAIQAARKEREFERLDAIGAQLKELRAARQDVAANQSKTYVWGEGGPFERIRKMDRQIAALEKEGARTIKDMSANGLGSEKSLGMLLQDAQESFSASKSRPAVAFKASSDPEEAFAQLENMGKRLGNLRERRISVVRNGTGTQSELKAVRELDAQIAALEKNGQSAIAQMSQNGMGKEGALKQIFQYAQESAPSAKPRAGAAGEAAKPVRYAQRSLMPKAPKETPKGLFEPRADGLVYMEAHPTDPAKAVFYYADETGNAVRAREVSMSQYETLMKGMSDADKAVLGRSSDLYGAAVESARREREFERLDAIGKQLRELRAQRMTVERTGKGTPADFKQIRELERQIAALEKEGSRTIKDMSSNAMGSESSLKQIFQYAQESVPAQTVKPAGAVSAYAKRSLMPKAPKETPKGLFEPRADGLVYMEAHPSDPTKAVFYYADETGNAVRAREVSMSRYETLIKGMSDADKAVLGRSSELYGQAVQAARKEREFERLEALGKQLKELRAQRQDIAANQSKTYVWNEGGPFARIREIDRQIAATEKEAVRTVRDMSSNGLGSENALKQILQYAQESR